MKDSHLHVKEVVTEPVENTTWVAGREKVVSVENMIVVLADNLPDPETGEVMADHPIYISVEAVASRMHAYGVKTPEEAIEAILKEHAVRLHGLEIKEHKAAFPKYKKLGGLSDEVEITWASGTKSQRDEVLKEHADKIKSEHAARAPRETSTKEN